MDHEDEAFAALMLLVVRLHLLLLRCGVRRTELAACAGVQQLDGERCVRWGELLRRAARCLPLLGRG